jgi:hypothetical protein
MVNNINSVSSQRNTTPGFKTSPSQEMMKKMNGILNGVIKTR